MTYASDIAANYVKSDFPAVFYSPHADDESLSMGLDIANHLIAGRNVLVVLMTQGCSDYALGQLNGRDDTYGYVHDPVREGYASGGPLSKNLVGVSRVYEFMSAVRAYNRLTGKLRYSVAGFADGTLSQGQARMVMEAVNNEVEGRASHKTMTYTDPASDHANCGLALRSMRNEGLTADARYYVSHANLQRTKDAGINPMAVSGGSEAVTAMRAALRSYDAWSPALGAYAFGRHSVGAEIDRQIAAPTQWYHA